VSHSIAVSQPGDSAIDANTGGRVLVFHVLLHQIEADVAEVPVACNSGQHVLVASTYVMKWIGGHWVIDRTVRGSITHYDNRSIP
jgi:hypothetical protein